MCSKDDFLDWGDDLNLSDILGEYTASDEEMEGLDDEYFPEIPSRPSEASVNDDSNINNNSSSGSSRSSSSKKRKDFVYECPTCGRKYISVTGFRGHVKRQHNIHKIHVMEHRINTVSSLASSTTMKHACTLSDSEFSIIFNIAFVKALEEMQTCQFLSSPQSINGTNILSLAKDLLLIDNTDFKMALHTLFSNIFKSSEADRSRTVNESLFSAYYTHISNRDVCLNLYNILYRYFNSNVSIKQFISCLEDKILSIFIKERAKTYEKSTTSDEMVSFSDQQVLYYISGYILSKLSKDCKKHLKNPKYAYFFSLIEQFTLQADRNAKPYVQKFSEWTNLQSRGGLKKPCDNFYLLIRQFENIVRTKFPTNLSCISHNSLNFINVKEALLSDFMIKYYWEQLCNHDNPEFSSFLLERIITLFLSVRGFSVARKTRFLLSSEKIGDGRNSLRKDLKAKN